MDYLDFIVLIDVHRASLHTDGAVKKAARAAHLVATIPPNLGRPRGLRATTNYEKDFPTGSFKRRKIAGAQGYRSGKNRAS